jgi:hypothetical protein
MKAEMGNEAVLVGRGVGCLEGLRSCHVAGGPGQEGHSKGHAFLCLASNVTRDGREDEIALGEEELCAVGANEAAGVVLGGLDCGDDDGTENCRDGPNLRRSKYLNQWCQN